MSAVILALGAALAWGTGDYFGGLKSRTISLPWVLLVSQSTSLAILATAVATLGGPPPSGEFLLTAAVSGLSEAIAIAALYRGFAIGTISIVAPVAALAPAVPLVASLALGEIPRTIQAVGLILAIAGIVVASRRPSDGREVVHRKASIVYGLLAALGFGVFFTAMDAASEGGVPWALFVARLTAVAVIVGVTVLARARPRVGWRDVPGIAGIGVLVVAGDAMYASATTLGLLAVAAVLGALHTLVTIGWAAIHLREQLDRFQRLGIAASLIGVLTITAF